jgi:hypothetical protein
MIEQFPYLSSGTVGSTHFKHRPSCFCIKPIVRPVAVDQCACIIIPYYLFFVSTISYALCDKKHCLKKRKRKSKLFFCTFRVLDLFLVFIFFGLFFFGGADCLR